MMSAHLDRLLFTVYPEDHSRERLTAVLKEHPEVKFVSFVGIDIGGHDTDEKIPVDLFIKDMEQFFEHGVQTDGSSVVLPGIAALNNAKVDIIPDLNSNWFVDYNWNHLGWDTDLPVGTLRIPAFLLHNDCLEVGSRVLLRNAEKTFKAVLLQLIKENPYIVDHLPIDSPDDIEEILLTGATELEFWVRSPEDRADREQLSTSQELKEQYWQRTRGSVRTALEEALMVLDCYGFGVEMGHKEVGGVKARLSSNGEYDHIMEQLEIDWTYSTPLQASDNDLHIRYVVKDVFRAHGLDVTFMAKPIEGVAGSGKHTHMGVAARLKNGKKVNLFAPMDMMQDFMNPIGYGALMGLLKNYEVMNPFIASSNDAINRLRPGFEAPVCVVTSLGRSTTNPSRNRTVLAGLVRELKSPMSLRFELRSPCPKSNTYLVFATAYLSMLDGIRAVLEAGKTEKELEAIISKKAGEEAFYLEKDRAYRSEEDVFDGFTQEERDRFFGKPPATVWENLCGFKKYEAKLDALLRDNVFDHITLESYRLATLAQWAMELHNRIIPNMMDLIRECRQVHSKPDCTDYDIRNWEEIQKLRKYLGQDTIKEKSLLTRIKTALDSGDYQTASDLQIEMMGKVGELVESYAAYRKNLF